MPDSVISKKLLISWDFHAQVSKRVQKNKKHTVSSSSAGKNALLMREFRGEGPGLRFAEAFLTLRHLLGYSFRKRLTNDIALKSLRETPPRLVKADRKLTIMQITTHYSSNMQKSISEYTTCQTCKWIGYSSRKNKTNK